MQLKAHVEEIVQTMTMLPPDKVAQLQDFARFLKQHYAKDQAIDYSMEWTETDLREWSQAVWQHAEESMPWDGKPDGTEKV